jgi:hypothetical protein
MRILYILNLKPRKLNAEVYSHAHSPKLQVVNKNWGGATSAATVTSETASGGMPMLLDSAGSPHRARLLLGHGGCGG